MQGQNEKAKELLGKCKMPMLIVGNFFIIFSFVVIALSDIFGNGTTGGSTVFIVVGTIVVLVIAGVVYGKKDREEREAKRVSAELISFDQYTLTAILLKIDTRIWDVIKIEDSYYIYTKYEPEKLHIGAASVGGVTTGGAYKTGGYNYIAASSKSGTCYLQYDGHIIVHIKLTDEMFKDAQKSSIAPYLDDAQKCINVHNPVQRSTSELMMSLKNIQSTGNAGNDFRGYPSREKCEQI